MVETGSLEGTELLVSQRGSGGRRLVNQLCAINPCCGDEAFLLTGKGKRVLNFNRRKIKSAFAGGFGVRSQVGKTPRGMDRVGLIPCSEERMKY